MQDREMSREEAIKRLEEGAPFSELYDPRWEAALALAIKALKAEPIRHGHWCVTQAYPHTVYCSECFKRFAQAHWQVWEDGSLPRNYCPNCGAKMDEANDGNHNQIKRGCEMSAIIHPTEDDYCSLGERKEI